MTPERGERADAARNRRAILAATEELLATLGPEQVSMERIAAAAGVGKGTVFHRFGSRNGLFLALMQERAYALEDAVRTAPPPLGPGAPPRERLLAFVTAIATVVGRNKGLMAALGIAITSTSAAPASTPSGACHPDTPPGERPVYDFWHSHTSELLAAGRPDLDADLLAHILLGALQSEPILRLLREGAQDRLAAALRTVAASLLDGPPP
ncbi:Transcriptional regulator BetI [Frankia canadensis]|uniref:Transcriptional regulator BetI n=1 Tax=Frankia canadensis TaxID=1836972 RepID=A0A2I2KND3_9ACTN|nr:TetR/AcrR family transcriptional regulator [Frankia canadensis]SNQ47170.1 Transcriptional regulator BetI [Frankia canadensis]SOU54460.1 Transcriptional regulator BetI [Frankia canadensis]